MAVQLGTYVFQPDRLECRKQGGGAEASEYRTET
jgi:hypothetical protein